MKFVIIKVYYQPEMGKKQDIYVMLDKSYKLFGANSLEDARKNSKEIFGSDLSIGKEICESANEKYFFANFMNNVDEPMDLPSGWEFILFNELEREKTPDYDIIKNTILRLGYEL